MIIFVRKNPENPLVLQTIVPLLNILRVTPAKSTTNQFLQKIIAFLKNKLSKATEHPKVEDVENALEILTAVHDFTKTKGSNNKELADMGIQLSMYLRKCIFGGVDIMISKDMSKDTKQRLEKTNAIYCANLCDYYRSKKHTRIEYDLAAFLPKHFPYSSWPLIDSLLEFINPSACHNNYRHTQNLEWISTVVNRTVDKVCFVLLYERERRKEENKCIKISLHSEYIVIGNIRQAVLIHSTKDCKINTRIY